MLPWSEYARSSSGAARKRDAHMHMTIDKASNGWTVRYVTDSGSINTVCVYTSTDEMMKDMQEKIAKYGSGK